MFGTSKDDDTGMLIWRHVHKPVEQITMKTEKMIKEW